MSFASRMAGPSAVSFLLVLCALMLGRAAAQSENNYYLDIDMGLAEQLEDSGVVKVKSPMAIDFSPDGEYMFIAQKEGQLWLVEKFQPRRTSAAVNLEERLVLDLSDIMCTNGERAIGGIALHPAFPKKPWVYIYYTYDKYADCDAAANPNTGPVNRFSRFEWDLNKEVVDRDSEKVLFDTPRVVAKVHNSGDIAFGKDGNVYVTVGDSGGRTDKNAAGVYFPQAMDRLLGKVIRLTENGDVPPDNPYADHKDGEDCAKDGLASLASKICREIFSTGHRNPIRFAMNPNTRGDKVEYYINEVGRMVWEEINPGGTEYAGANYGYPERTGMCIKDSEDGCTPSPAMFTDPVHWYKHDPDLGGAVTAGVFVPDYVSWPDDFDGAYLYADYSIGGIYVMRPGGKGCSYDDGCDPPVSPFEKKMLCVSKKTDIIQMKFGPAGENLDGSPRYALYYVSRDGAYRGVRKIEFTGEANRRPIAKISADRTFGFAPLFVQFDGGSSYDADGDGLKYEWDLDGDGKVDSFSTKTSYAFKKDGSHIVTLSVRDGKGGKSTTFVQIEVNNSPPIPEIISPKPGTLFSVGDEILLVGKATDPEEGELDETVLTWEIRQVS